jgi:uncharacterized protein
MAHTLCHFELFADEPAKLAAFYETVFGWKIVDAMEGYMFIDTGGGKGAAGGGIEKNKPGEERVPLNYFLVESIVEYTKKIEKAGGLVLKGKSPVPGFGYFAIIKDPGDNTFGIWEPDREAK